VRLSSTLSTCILKTFRDGDTSTSLGKLFQSMIALNVKKLLMLKENLSLCNLHPLHPVFIGVLVKKSL